MTLLLDTHVFLWWRVDSARLKPAARRVIASSDRVFVSAVSAWEAALKHGLGRLKVEDPFGWMIADSGFAEPHLPSRTSNRLLCCLASMATRSTVC